MNKQDLLNLANKGKVTISGIELEVIVKPSSLDGTPWLEIHVPALSPLHLPFTLGEKWVEYITDEECAELPDALLRYKCEAEEFCRKAERVVKATRIDNDHYRFELTQEERRDIFGESIAAHHRATAPDIYKYKCKIVFVNDSKKEWFAPGIFTLELDGVRYVPHWSYWLERAYYISQK